MAKRIFSPLNAPYYVFAPPYRENSGGVRAMHYLCHALNLMGEEAYVVTDKIAPKLRTPTLTNPVESTHVNQGRSPIVVYPEVVPDNPMHALNVVRFLLNTPELLTGQPSKWLDSDLIYSMGSAIIPPGMKAELLVIPAMDYNVYNSRGADDQKRHGKLLFINRYLTRGGKLDPLVSDATEISFRVGERSPQELADLYRSAELMYTYEHSTACLEAMLCGCPVVYLPNDLLLHQPYEGYFGRAGWAWGNAPASIEEAKRTVHLVAPAYETSEDTFWQQLELFIDTTQAKAAQNKSKRGADISAEPLKTPKNNTMPKNVALSDRLQSLLRHIAANPGDVEAIFHIALICTEQGMIEESTTLIHQALALAPERSDLQAQLGEYCLEKGYIDESRHHLAEAIARKPDLFPAYPSLAEAMRQSGQLSDAANLLESVARYPGPTQSAIVVKLLEILTLQGDLERIVENCDRVHQDMAIKSLGLRLQTRAGTDTQRLRQGLEHVHYGLCPPSPQAPATRPNVSSPKKIAFVLSDFQHKRAARHIELLLCLLPAADFYTILVDNDTNSPGVELAERSILLADRYIPAKILDDNSLVQSLKDVAPDILIDMDGPGARHRLAAICRVNASLTLSWNDLPPWGLPCLRQMCGEKLGAYENGSMAPLALGELGELLEFPSVDIIHDIHEAPRFACLTPSIHVSQDSWDCYATLLERVENAIMVINLGELGSHAQQRISNIFSQKGIKNDRLYFVQATNTDALCAIWNEVDIGLAPLHGDGDDALPTCLWMERPYVALDATDPWSKRPAALLQLAELGHLVAQNQEHYLEIAVRLTQTPLTSLKRDWLQKSPLTNAQQFVDDFAKRLLTAITTP